jgi:hypothetical protein
MEAVMRHKTRLRSLHRSKPSSLVLSGGGRAETITVYAKTYGGSTRKSKTISEPPSFTAGAFLLA